MRKRVKNIKRIVKRYWKSFLGIILLLIVCNIFGTVHPFIMKQILEVDLQANDIQMVLLKLVIAYVLVHIGYAFFKNARNIKVNQIMAKVLKDIRTSVFEKVLHFKMKTFEKYSSAQIYTRLTNDVNELFNLFFSVLNVVVNNIVYLIFIVIMMFFANVSLAWIGFAMVLLIAISTMKFTNILGKIRRKFLRERDFLNKEFSEIYNKNKLTYLYHIQKKNMEKTNYFFRRELKFRKEYIFVHHFTYWVLIVLEAVGIYCVLYYALNINTSISVGTIYLVLFFIKECRGPLNEICDQMEEIQNATVSYQRIKELLKEGAGEDIEKGEEVEVIKGDIEFQNVCMKYNQEMVLKNVSFIIKEGSKVTIAGRTGAGKSTLVNVFMKLYDIESGKILIGNKDIHKLATKSLRNNISYISQNPYIFADTVRNNIRLGNEAITDEEILKLIQKMGADSLLAKLPEGLDTKIKAKEMSYGELQILAFIRAILHQANIYIFDEPTSNIDLKTEKMIQSIIDHIAKTSTIIIIAHRKSTIASSDKIIYLKDGQVDAIINKRD